ASRHLEATTAAAPIPSQVASSAGLALAALTISNSPAMPWWLALTMSAGLELAPLVASKRPALPKAPVDIPCTATDETTVPPPPFVCARIASLLLLVLLIL